VEDIIGSEMTVFRVSFNNSIIIFPVNNFTLK
jgi:hypothetical protein